MKSFIKKFMNDEQGQDLVEYSLLLVLLSLAALATLPLLGTAINNVFSRTTSALSGVSGS